nr:ATPase, T2SS/T4P/T4SS family [Nanchangia anserum]
MRRLARPQPRDPRVSVARGLAPAQAVSQARVPLTSAAQTWADKLALDAAVAGYGPHLAPLLADEAVTDVLVNDPHVAWVDRGEGLVAHPLALSGDELRALALSLAAAARQRLDDASPIVDGTLPDGTRLHAVLPPLSTWPLISLRTSRRRRLSVDDLVACGTIAPALEPVIRALVAERASTFISGATGSGKTTLLSALLGLVPTDQRILCIEEVTELRPDHPHVVHLQQRRGNVQAAGEVTMSDLVRAAMRMRPAASSSANAEAAKSVTCWRP